MQVTTQLLAFLARAMAGYARADQSDAILNVPPVLLNSESIPLPIQALFNAPSFTVRNITHAGASQIPYSASGGNQLTALGEGLWRVDWEHYQEVSGAVSDITAASDFRLEITGMTGSPLILSRIRGTLVEQSHKGSMILSVLKEQPVLFNNTISAGAGTASSFARVNLFCSKLL